VSGTGFQRHGYWVSETWVLGFEGIGGIGMSIGFHTTCIQGYNG